MATAERGGGGGWGNPGHKVLMWQQGQNCTQTALVLAIQQRRTGDSMALRSDCYVTPQKHTHAHTPLWVCARVCWGGWLCPCSRMLLLFESSHVLSCMRPLYSLFVPLAVCRLSPTQLCSPETDAEIVTKKIERAKVEGGVKLEVRCVKKKFRPTEVRQKQRL